MAAVTETKPPARPLWWRVVARVVDLLLLAAFLVIVAGAAVLYSPDPVSEWARPGIEAGINRYLEGARERAAANALTVADRLVLHSAILGGAALSWFAYPEGARVLVHAVYGGGSDLELDPSYFADSEYLRDQVRRLGTGTHGPLYVNQSDDWRLSLAFNPYYLDVTECRVRLYHPRMVFADPAAKPVHTVVPVGKLELRVWDNLVGALHPTPFAASSEWER